MLGPFEVFNLDIYHSSKTKLKEQNNSVLLWNGHWNMAGLRPPACVLLLHEQSSFIKIKVLNEEEYSILHILYCYSLQQHKLSSLHCATILTHTIACSHTFFSETKYCYSRNDVRSQLIPFSAIHQLWTGERANLQTLNIDTQDVQEFFFLVKSQR